MIQHHPKETTLAEFAAGTLDEGRSVVVAAHVAMCPHCRGFLSAFEGVGGALLDRIAPVAMSDDAKVKALQLLDEPDMAQLSGDYRSTPDLLSAYAHGPWRWTGPGLHWRALDVPSDSGTRVFMLRASPGLKLPSHRHIGTELTCVLSGSFTHRGGRFAAGDLDDADDSDHHDPVVDTGEQCICLVAMQGRLKLDSLLGRLIQPFVRL
jgi:putative transcriptional regulator